MSEVSSTPGPGSLDEKPRANGEDPRQSVRGQASPAPRRVFVETWGCQMNELDSQRMVGQMMQQGVLPTLRPEEADVILLNSCSVREKAEQKVYSRLGEYRLLKKERPGMVIGLCGCVAQQEGEKALQRVSDLDFVMGPARVSELANLVAASRAGQRTVATGFPADRPYEFDAISRQGEYKGMVTIIEGCNKSCTFCIVPKTRGPERSRTMAEVLAEVRHLVAYGFREIELLGQTVNHWRDPETGQDFADLLDAVAREDGVERLRFVTSYPKDFTPAMIEQIGRHPNICPYLHLPVQSGSDRLLRRMGRGYGRAEYLELVRRLRQARAELAISTDIIVGFPGETEEDFAETLELLEEVRFAVVFAFCYSERPGTAAPRLDGKVEPALASERLQRLFAVQDRIQRELNQQLIGRTFEILVTGWGKTPGTQSGRTSCHRIVHFPHADAPVALGATTWVEIETAHPHSLVARRVARAAA